jgi:hypothetical protein
MMKLMRGRETIEGHDWSVVDIRDNNVTFRSQTEEIRFDFRNGVSAEVVVDLKVFEISFIRGSVYSIKEGFPLLGGAFKRELKEEP